jgi:hypothetical protein
MNYYDIYYAIIERAKGRTKAHNLEGHHIVPKSCNGNDDLDNLVHLTMREHFICHKLLVKIYVNEPIYRKKMIYALWWMCKTMRSKNVRVTSHEYERARSLYIENHPNKDEDRKERFRKNFKDGLYNRDYEQVSKTLKKTLSKLSPKQQLERMKNSALTCNQEERRNAIKKAKGSKLQITKSCGTIVEFWTYEDVENITGYSYHHIRYKIKKCGGILNDGNTAIYLSKYKGNSN